MQNITIMIKPASSSCNMRCTYCFYNDVSAHRQVSAYGIMTATTAKRILNSIFRTITPGGTLTFAFQGGEPTLAGLNFYRQFVAMAKLQARGIKLMWSFQTNGILLDEEWCRFFSDNRFLIGLSYDLFLHDMNRLDSDGRVTAQKVMAAKRLLEQYCVEYNVLCVLTNALARHPQKVWNAVVNSGIKYIQFIPCLAGLEEDVSPYALTPQRFAHFYNGIIPHWHKAAMQGNLVSIRLIDDIITLLGTGNACSCGLTGKCSPQLIVEADGSAYPCDYYVLDELKLGNLAEHDITELLKCNKMLEFASCSASHESCDCPYWSLCGGGCRRLAHTICQDGFCGYRQILEHNIPVFQYYSDRMR